jgi:hypothetical protein
MCFKKRAGLFFLILAGVSFLAVRFVAQETCPEFPVSFAETFDTTTYRDSSRFSVDHWGRVTSP